MVMSTQHGETRRQRNPRGAGTRLREEIVSAVYGLLDDGEALSLRSIARRAGVSAPAIYPHFANVDAIMLAVAESAFDELSASLRTSRDSVTGPTAQVHAIANAYIAFAEQRPQLYRVMFGGVWNAKEALAALVDETTRVRAIGMETFAILQDAVELCVSAGVSRSDNPRRDATALWVALHGVADQSSAAPLFPWPDSLVDTLVDSLAQLNADATRG